MSGRYVVGTPWWNSPPKPSSYPRLPATTYLWSTSTSDSLQHLRYGPNVHQVSAASHVIMSMRYLADPLVELSSQTVILPQTPYNSFSMVHIYIRSVQLAT
ncbi:hypothetical protein J6590_088355 [Homalodisca vitripennis]|nr:hypothetical protein J6590_088355 [Homalodisca vitripennis]